MNMLIEVGYQIPTYSDYTLWIEIEKHVDIDCKIEISKAVEDHETIPAIRRCLKQSFHWSQL
jgi:hypothetical protein